MKKHLRLAGITFRIPSWIQSGSARCIVLYCVALCIGLMIHTPCAAKAENLVGLNLADRVVTGTVRDATGLTLPGVNVLIKGTNQGTSTDANGSFNINVPDNKVTLIFSFIGYKTVEVGVGERTTVDVTMETELSVLEEVVVVGYGTQKRKDLTGSVVSLGSEKFTERPVVNMEQAMAGQAAGVEISPRNASPGQISNIIVRGVSSISAGFSPLFVVDGFPTDQQNAQAINPADIASVDVLKDASATAIYGSRGANGVILITTKTAKEGKSTFGFNATTGVANVSENDFYHMLNASEYVQYEKEAYTNNGAAVPAAVLNWDGKTNTNWQKLIYRSAPYQNYTLSATGGTGKATSSLSLGYINQQGIVKGTDYKKFSARVRVDFRPSDKVRIGLNIAPNYSVTNNMPDNDFGSPVGAAVYMPAIIPVKMPDGSYGNTQKFPGLTAIQLANPLQIIDLYKSQTKSLYNIVNADIEWEITSGLKVRSSFGVNTSSVVNETFNPSTLAPLPHPATAGYSNSSYLNWLNENTISYSKSINQLHSINILGGVTAQNQQSSFVYLQANNFPTNGVQTLNAGTVLPAGSGTTKSEWSLLSFLARANYDYGGRFLVTGTIRTDGSSRFGANKRYGVFPSGAVAWRLSEESFMKGISMINSAKIRASYGRTGNNLIPDFAPIGLLTTVNQPFGLGTGSNNIGLTPSSPANPNLTWEVCDQTDIGLDLTAFNSRLNITVDYYKKLTKDLLLQVPVTSTTGYQNVLQNIGKMRVTGIELVASYQILDSKFKWNLGGNFATMNQKVLALGPDGSPLVGFFGALVTKVGGKLEEAQGLNALGILRQSDIDNGYPLFGASKAGDYKYQDVNKDGKVDGFNQADGILLGNNMNKYIYGITNTFRYGNFDMSVLLQGQGGGKVYDLAYQLGALGITGINSLKFYYDGRYISESNPGDGKTPRAGFFGAGTPASFMMNPTDFTRIRNITLGYSIPSSVYAKTGIKSLRAYVSIDNLYTFKKFEGGNPSATRFNIPNGVSDRLVSDGRLLGLNSTPSVPLPRTYSVGVALKF